MHHVRNNNSNHVFLIQCNAFFKWNRTFEKRGNNLARGYLGYLVFRLFLGQQSRSMVEVYSCGQMSEGAGVGASRYRTDIPRQPKGYR